MTRVLFILFSLGFAFSTFADEGTGGRQRKPRAAAHAPSPAAPTSPTCLSIAQRIAFLSVAKLRPGSHDFGPILPASFSGKIHLTSGIRHLVPKAEGQAPTYKGEVILTAASKPQEFATVTMGGNGFGFGRNRPEFHKTDSSLGPLMKLQYDGTGSILFGAFYQIREGRPHVLITPMSPEHSQTGQLAAVPELGAVETPLTGGASFFHIVPLPDTPMAILLKGGFDYQTLLFHSKAQQIALAPSMSINPLRNPTKPRDMTLQDVIDTGFHWHYVGPHLRQGAATIYYSLDASPKENGKRHFLAPASMEPNLQMTVDWERSIPLISSDGKPPLAVRVHPKSPLVYVVYSNHYEVFIYDPFLKTHTRLEESASDGKKTFEFPYPSGVQGIQDIHFYYDVVDKSTGETTLKVAAISLTEKGEPQVIWLDDNRH